MGHIALDTARKLVKDGSVSGIELMGKGDAGSCDLCEYDQEKDQEGVG